MPQPGDLFETPSRIDTPADIQILVIPQTPNKALNDFPAGKNEASDRLEEFAAESIFTYEEQRNLPSVEGPSKLSPYLRFGMISARQTAVAARMAIDGAPDGKSRIGAETLLNELIWHDFYINILYHFPHVRRGNFNRKYDHIAWINNRDQLKAWQDGHTGYPIVDAAMRQLVQSDWMHNRTRMIAASFLVKDLIIDLRLGEAWFMQHLWAATRLLITAAGSGRPEPEPMPRPISAFLTWLRRAISLTPGAPISSAGCQSLVVFSLNS